MKNIWKFMGIALAAGMIPYKADYDIVTGEKTYQALFWKLTSRPDPESEKGRHLTVDIGIQSKRKEEAEMYADELLTASADEHSFGGDEVIPF